MLYSGGKHPFFSKNDSFEHFKKILKNIKWNFPKNMPE